MTSTTAGYMIKANYQVHTGPGTAHQAHACPVQARQGLRGVPPADQTDARRDNACDYPQAHGVADQRRRNNRPTFDPTFDDDQRFTQRLAQAVPKLHAARMQGLRGVPPPQVRLQGQE